MKIGVFDSGVGGRAVANAVQEAFPNEEVVYAQDRKNVPYGSKRVTELRRLVKPIIQKLESEGCDLIVVACNTVSTTIIDDLRKSVSVPLIAVEPMLEAARKATKTGVIAVCATPRTLKSERYANLKKMYASGLVVLEPDCSNWALMIEREAIDRAQIRETISDCLAKNADVIVLGCTHYHWVEEIIDKVVGDRAVILQPEQDAVIAIKQALSQLR